MLPDGMVKSWVKAVPQVHVPQDWTRPLMRLIFAWMALALLTRHDWAVMFDKWWNISTYNHILLVPPIIGWIVWSRRKLLGQLTPQGWWPGLALLGIALFLWLLGATAGVNSASQFGAILAFQASVVALLGPRVAAGLLFPLAYMFFLIPFGDEIVPALQMITAKLVIAFTHWSGIPAVIDGVFIDTPAGLFEVAEACSGVKFLVAMIALGALVAQSCFKSWRRRTLFLIAAVAVPVLANGVRAWGTIYIAQSQGIKFAQGFDHIFYGWIFFALVVASLLAASWRWFDRAPDDQGPDIASITNSSLLARFPAGSIKGSAALGAAIGLVALFAVWSVLASRMEARLPPRVALPHVPGWQQIAYAPTVPWQPRASGAALRLIGRYRSAAGQDVDVFIAIYASQREGHEASAFGEGALTPDTPWRWLAPGRSTKQANADYLLAYGNVRRLTETSYRTGGMTTGSAVSLKLAAMRDHLLLRRQPTILAILSAEEHGGTNAAQTIGNFRSAIGDEGEWMDHIAGLR